MDRHTHDDLFVERQMAALAPAWTPDAVRARARLDHFLHTRRVLRTLVFAGAAAMALAALALTPQARTYAQDVWARWTMTRVEVMTTTTAGPGIRQSFRGGGNFTSQVDAERAVGFTLRLPPVAAGVALQFSVLNSLVIEETIDVAALETALHAVGATDVVVPREWDGTTIRVHVRNVVIALYADELVISQAAPPSLDVPVGIPLSDLATTMYRASGMPAEAARVAGLAYAIRPAWLLRVRADERTQVERLSLRNGDAWLMSEVDSDGRRGAATVMRSGDDRIYVVTSPRREQAVAVAAELP
jgi:hypothetical protein